MGTAGNKTPTTHRSGSPGWGWEAALWLGAGVWAMQGPPAAVTGWPSGQRGQAGAMCGAGGSPHTLPSAGVRRQRSRPVSRVPPRLVAIVIPNITQRYEGLKVASFPARLNRSPGMSIIPTSQLSPSRYVSRGQAWHYMKVKGIQ